jgi:hypothetical protein
MRRVQTTGAAALLAALLMVAGCGGREFAEVEGTVTLRGVPLPEVEVTFIPDAAKGNSGNNATALTDAQGRYKLRAARDGRDGTVLGPHRVVVIDLPAVADFTTAGTTPLAGEGAAPKASGPKQRRFPAAYGDPTDTPLRDVEVKPGKQTLDFDLKAQGR